MPDLTNMKAMKALAVFSVRMTHPNYVAHRAIPTRSGAHHVVLHKEGDQFHISHYHENGTHLSSRPAGKSIVGAQAKFNHSVHGAYAAHAYHEEDK